MSVCLSALSFTKRRSRSLWNFKDAHIAFDVLESVWIIILNASLNQKEHRWETCSPQILQVPPTGRDIIVLIRTGENQEAVARAYAEASGELMADLDLKEDAYRASLAQQLLQWAIEPKTSKYAKEMFLRNGTSLHVLLFLTLSRWLYFIKASCVQRTNGLCLYGDGDSHSFVGARFVTLMEL